MDAPGSSGAAVRFRIATSAPADQDALWTALHYAAHVDDEPGRTVADTRRTAALQRYVGGWGRPGDLAVIAEAPDGRLLGAAWLRLHAADEQTTAEFVDERTPELGIGVLPESQGAGVGTRLLGTILEHASGRYPAIVLSVREGNPARRLYERFGFVVVGTMTNRVGTSSAKMVRILS